MYEVVGENKYLTRLQPSDLRREEAEKPEHVTELLLFEF